MFSYFTIFHIEYFLHTRRGKNKQVSMNRQITWHSVIVRVNQFKIKEEEKWRGSKLEGEEREEEEGKEQ